MKLHFRNINPQIERNNFANSEMKVTFATTHVAWCTKLARTFRSTLVIDWTYVCEAVLPAYLIAFRVLWLLAERPKARVVGVRGWLGRWVARWLAAAGSPASAGCRWLKWSLIYLTCLMRLMRRISGCGWPAGQLGGWLGGCLGGKYIYTYIIYIFYIYYKYIYILFTLSINIFLYILFIYIFIIYIYIYI